MAKNREPVKPVEPQSESGEEDDEGSSEEVSESEPEPTQTSLLKKTTPPPPQQPASSSEEEEDTGSESESESEEPESNVVKPLALRNGGKKTASKPKSSEPEPVTLTKPSSTPAKPSAAKRPADDPATAASDAKKKKTAELDTAEKKPNVNRVWTEDDEIVILKGLIEYANKKKSDPMSDLNSFHDFIKKNLHADFTKIQLQDKIRRLKKKFGNYESKANRTFSSAHEESAYDLSMEIWGKGNVVGSPNATKGSAVSKKTATKKANVVAEPPVKQVKNTVVVSEKAKFNSRVVNGGGGSLEENMLVTGRELYESGKGLEGESEWNRLKVEDLKLYHRLLEVRLEQTKLVIEQISEV